MRFLIHAVGLLLPILILPSCNSGGLSSDGIVGVKWEASTMGGEEVQPNEKGLKPFIKLNPPIKEKHLVGGLGGCNMFMARYELEGDKISITGPRSSNETCPYIRTEVRFMEALQKADQYELKGDRLELKAGGQTTMVFIATPDS